MEMITKNCRGGGSRTWAGLLGVCVAAALLAVFGMATEVSAQTSEPTIDGESGEHGWAADLLEQDGNQDLDFRNGTVLTAVSYADGSQATGATWSCNDLRCFFLNLRWSNITPNPEHVNGKPAYTITLERRAPSPAELGISEADFATKAVPTIVSLPVADASAREQRVPLPWANQIIEITGAPGSSASFTLSTPGIGRFLGEDFSTRDTRSASTLVTDSANNNLPTLVSVWPKVEGATHYEVQYTFRTRSDDPGQALTRVTRIESGSQIVGTTYAGLNANWSQARNRTELEALDSSDFNNDGGWIVVVTTLPKLLAGAEGWPKAEATAEPDIVEALGEGRNAVGIRIRPVLACATDLATHARSDLCSKDIHEMAPEAEVGRQGKISYVRFEGDTMAEWVSSAGTAAR